MLKNHSNWSHQFMKILNMESICQGLRPLPPAPFGFSGLPFGGLGASILTFWQEDGFDMVLERILFDFERTWEPWILVFCVQEARNSIFSDLFPGHFLWNSEAKFRCWDSTIEVFATTVFQKSICPWNRFLWISASDFVVFGWPWEPSVWFLVSWKQV